MSKEEPSRGLLSRVVRFVRNPTAPWAEAEASQDDRDSQYSKQMLKEMIERKRRNDFVRRREFDQLRRLRQRDALQGQRTEDDDAAQRPSFLEVDSGLGGSSSDDRAGTIRKIDEIEAQMSQQWWRSRHAPLASASPSAPPPTSTASLTATTIPSSLLLASETDTRQARAFAPTVPFRLSSLAQEEPGDVFAQAWAVRPAVRADAAPPAAPPAAAPAAFRHDPDLEEAAIRFAHGDTAGAEAALRELLTQRAQDAPERQFELWMALFDLYRATGRQEPFDALAIEFAARFGRSAPLWFSLPELAGVPAEAPAEPPSALPAREFRWVAPSELGPQSVAALQAATQRAAAPWDLTWSRLQAIDSAAVPGLADLFTQWADQGDVRLVLHGVDTLLEVLQAATPSGDGSAPPQAWRLRLAALRLMGRLEEFDLVAMDYCVTYEVSPPSWVPPRCACSGGGGSTDWAALEELEREHPSGFGVSLDSSRMPLGNEPPSPLAGVVEGDAMPLLAPLQEQAPPGAPLVVACDRLIRIDFAAAGSVLNWAADLQSQGHAVQFVHLSRLVAVFFNVIGINEHARVVPRAH